MTGRILACLRSRGLMISKVARRFHCSCNRTGTGYRIGLACGSDFGDLVPQGERQTLMVARLARCCYWAGAGAINDEAQQSRASVARLVFETSRL